MRITFDYSCIDVTDGKVNVFTQKKKKAQISAGSCNRHTPVCINTHSHSVNVILSTGVGISQQTWERRAGMTHGLRLCPLDGKPARMHVSAHNAAGLIEGISTMCMADRTE